MHVAQRKIKRILFISGVLSLIFIVSLLFVSIRQWLISRQNSSTKKQPLLPGQPKRKIERILYISFFLILVFIVSLLFVSIGQWLISRQNSSVTTLPLLPGQQHWKQGVSSYLFGTNDTYEYSFQNIETQPAIQVDLRNAGFTLMRSFFTDNASDAAIEQNMRTIENSGAHCLGVIPNIYNVTFDEHLVRYLGHRCLMYEFGNESDYNNISITSYLRQWNMLIPALRYINPAAKFIGPVTYNPQGVNDYMKFFLEGVKTSGVLPDAISFHWYPCYWSPEAQCLAKASSYGQVARQVEALVQSVLGKNLPVGISEWNFDAALPPPPYGDDAAFITKFTNEALQSMAEAHVAFACQFDAASYSGYGHLDMFQVDTAQPKPQFYAIKDLIQEYRPAA